MKRSPERYHKHVSFAVSWVGNGKWLSSEVKTSKNSNIPLYMFSHIFLSSTCYSHNHRKMKTYLKNKNEYRKAMKATKTQVDEIDTQVWKSISVTRLKMLPWFQSCLHPFWLQQASQLPHTGLISGASCWAPLVRASFMAALPMAVQCDFTLHGAVPTMK